MKKEDLEKIEEICDRAHAEQVNVAITINDDRTGSVTFISGALSENWVGKTHSLPLALEAASEFLDSRFGCNKLKEWQKYAGKYGKKPFS